MALYWILLEVMTEDDIYSHRRRHLYDYFFEEFSNQYINYKKYYIASSGLGKWGRRVNYSTTIMSALLLALIGTITTSVQLELTGWLPLAVSVLTAALAFVNAVGNFQLRSNQYYNAGQQHQHLFEKMEHFATVRLPDPNENIKQLEYDATLLLEEKNRLNESTPQISNRWYNKVKDKNQLNWEQVPLEEVPGESYQH